MFSPLKSRRKIWSFKFYVIREIYVKVQKNFDEVVGDNDNLFVAKLVILPKVIIKVEQICSLKGEKLYSPGNFSDFRDCQKFD